MHCFQVPGPDESLLVKCMLTRAAYGGLAWAGLDWDLLNGCTKLSLPESKTAPNCSHLSVAVAI